MPEDAGCSPSANSAAEQSEEIKPGLRYATLLTSRCSLVPAEHGEGQQVYTEEEIEGKLHGLRAGVFSETYYSASFWTVDHHGFRERSAHQRVGGYLAVFGGEAYWN